MDNIPDISQSVKENLNVVGTSIVIPECGETSTKVEATTDNSVNIANIADSISKVYKKNQFTKRISLHENIFRKLKSMSIFYEKNNNELICEMINNYFGGNFIEEVEKYALTNKMPLYLYKSPLVNDLINQVTITMQLDNISMHKLNILQELFKNVALSQIINELIDNYFAKVFIASNI